MTRPGADERLRRLLAMIPWVAAQEGPTVEEVCQRFDLGADELARDLELLFMCGLHPFSPDMLMEADIAEGRVWIRYAEYFSRPLRLTPAEGLALVAAGAALLGVPGAEPEGPLARGLAKVARVLGIEGDEAVAVDLPAAEPDRLDRLQRASADRRQVDIDYYAYGRDEQTSRTIDPWSVFSAAGQWYVLGYCHRAEAERLFRLDRISRAEVRDAEFIAPARPVVPATYHPRADDPIVVLDLAALRPIWVAEYYPNEGVEHLDSETVRVRLRAGERARLERLLLELGSDAAVIEGADGVGGAAAQRVLTRYGPG